MKLALYLRLSAGLIGLLTTVGTLTGRARPLPSRSDSLLTSLRYSKPDTQRVQLLLTLGRHHLPVRGKLQLDLQIATHYVRVQPSELAIAAQYARRAETLSDSLHYPRGVAQSLLLRARTDVQQRRSEQARATLDSAAAIFRQLHDAQGLGDCYYLRGGSFPYIVQDSLAAMQAFRRAIGQYRRAGNRLGEVWALREMADLLNINGLNDHALPLIRQLMQLEKTLPEQEPHRNYFLLTYTYSQNNDLAQALRYALLTVQTARAAPDTSLIHAYYHRLGVLYFYLKDYANSTLYCQKALRQYQLDGNNYMQFTMVFFITNTMMEQGHAKDALRFARQHLPPLQSFAYNQRIHNEVSFLLARIYAANGDYQRAEQYATIPSPEDFSHYSKVSQAGLHHLIGIFFVNIRKYEKARYHLNQALRIHQYQGHASLYMIAQEHYHLFRIDSTLGNLRDAIAHYQQFKVLSDSTFSEQKNKEIAQLQVQFDTRQKEQDIRLLQQQNTIQRASIERDRLLLGVSVGGTLMLILLLGVIYNRYRLKQRSVRMLQAQQDELQAQHEELQTQQEVIHQKNTYLTQLISEKNTLLEEKDLLLIEKEWLLKEIHHRVKNNLQVIMSLLGTQRHYLTDQVALSAIDESRNRVQAMSLIHLKLYQSDEFSRIDAREYLQEVIGYLSDSFQAQDRIAFRLEVAPLMLDVAQAVPLGLIVNEAVTNALKYAFPDGARGLIALSLQPLPRETPKTPQYLQLSISDNGKGLPAHFNPSRESLGMSLMKGLSRQLGGQFYLENNGGVHIRIHFAESVVTVRHIPSLS